MTALATLWPGKSDASGARHPALWHMLDVAAVAELILPRGRLGGLSTGVQQALLFLIALHDCGKMSCAFRDQIEKGKSPDAAHRHWRLSRVILRHHDEKLGALIGGTEEARYILYDAVSGHHGQPPTEGNRRQTAAVGECGFAATAELIESIAPLFAPAMLGDMQEDEAARLSWLLSGTTVVADWVGSNVDWFAFVPAEMSVQDYWTHARQTARRAVSLAGLSATRLREVNAAALVGRSLRPMQASVAEVDLPEGPVLAVIEDTTGAGKTEAALILANRMIAAGKAGGVYFALPTMATADAMFQRMRPLLRRLFDGDPSLALAHGRRHLNEAFRDVRGSWGARPTDAGCAEWIADDRRRSFLAEIGVGTIDQALMAVLPTRFNTLRMAALADRVIIVDEAHSYDPYMEKELQTLLRFHAAFGGSAIAMTATLPADMRNGLVSAWLKRNKATRKAPVLPDLSRSYPALSLIGDTVVSGPVAPVPAMCRRVAVKRLPDFLSAVAAIRVAQAQGAACLWVRNAVDDAIAAVEALRAEGIAADLLHARYAMCDRQGIEGQLTGRYGRDGQGREGRVLVATQIVEMSLDLDFDVMVSDLAPIGSLVQRAGRLWRHMDMRPENTRPVAGPVLHLLSPDPAEVEDARWLHRVLDRGAFVYRQDDQWRTAQVLAEVGAINAPDGLRDLIAAVHGETAPDVPDPLMQAEIEGEGRDHAATGLAQMHLLNPTRAFGAQENIFDDTYFPTRLGEPQMTLVLARTVEGVLTPWFEDPHPVRAMAMSEVQLVLRKYRDLPLAAMQSASEIVAFTEGWKDWERETKAVAVVGQDGAICEGLQYDPVRGLMLSPDRDEPH